MQRGSSVAASSLPWALFAGLIDLAAMGGQPAPHLDWLGHVRDSAGNAAQEVRRRVYVTNPCKHAGADPDVPERVCSVEADGDVTCSVSGGDLCSTIDFEESEDDAEKKPPTVALIGPEQVSVAQGELYAACPSEPPLDLVCDKGAQASDELDGDLTDMILACTPDGTTNRFINKGVTGCSIDTGVPGVYVIAFSVKNSVRLSATATRTLTVIAACPAGEALCADMVTCSERGVCLGGLGESAVDEEPAAVDAVPNVTLRTSLAVPSAFVDVKQHGTYMACAVGEEEQADVLCEPGATAHDDEDGDLTSKVLACPPESCLSTGCPGHEWASKGLQGCLNTSADVGTVFDIRFVVYDSMVPAQNDSVTRVVTIVQPCSGGDELCSDMTCSPIPCDERDAQFSSTLDDTAPPTIELLHSDPVRVIYGNSTSSAWLRPCANLSEHSTSPPHACLATAVDDTSGDVSSSLEASQDTQCAGCSSGGCQLERAFECFPGTYGYIWSAADASGNHANLRQTVKVVEEAAVSATLNLSAGTNDVAAAEERAESLRLDGSSEALAFQQGLATLLNDGSSSAGEEVQSSDVTITAVHLKDALGRHVSSSENATGSGELFLEVHYTVTVLVAGSEASGALGRRLLCIHKPADALAWGRRLLDAGADTLAQRTEDVSAMLVSSTYDGTMSASLAAAAEINNASLATEVAEASENPIAARVTTEVDSAAAYEVSIAQQMAELRRGSSQLSGGLAEVLGAVALAGGNPDEWKEALTETWEAGQSAELSHIDELMTLVAESGAKLDRNVSQYDIIPEDANTAALEQEVETGKTQSDELNVALDEIEPKTTVDDEHEHCNRFSMDVDHKYYFTVGVNQSGHRRQLLKAARKGGASSGSVRIEVHKGGLVSGGGNDFRQYWDAELPGDEALTNLEMEPTDEQVRYVCLGRQRLVAGLLIQVTRVGTEQKCTERFERIKAPCHTRTAKPEGYGSDSVFSTDSKLFRVGMQDDIGLYYNTSDGSDMINPITSQPIAFMPRKIPGSPNAHPVYIDARIGGYRAKELYTFMEDGNFMDKTVKQVTAEWVLWNPHTETWTTMHLTWHHETGSWQTEFDIASIDIGALTGMAPSDGGATAVTALHWVWALLSMGSLVDRLRLMRHAATTNIPPAATMAFRGSQLGSRALRGLLWLMGMPNFSLAALRAYLSQPLIQFSLTCSVVHVLAVLVYEFAVYYVDEELRMEPSYAVDQDLYARANYFLSRRQSAATAASIEGEGAAWALPEDNSGFERYLEDVNTVQTSSWLIRLMFKLHALQIVMLMIQSLVVCETIQHLRVVTRSVRQCIMIFMTMLPVFGVCVFGFAVLYNVEYGTHSPYVVNLSQSINVISGRTLLGDYKELAAAGQAIEALRRNVRVIYNVTQTFLMSFCVNNFLFAIYSDILNNSLEGARNQPQQDLAMLYKTCIKGKIQSRWPSLDRVHALLCQVQYHYQRQRLNVLTHSSNIEDSLMKRLSKGKLLAASEGDMQASPAHSKVCGCALAELADAMAAAFVWKQHQEVRRGSRQGDAFQSIDWEALKSHAGDDATICTSKRPLGCSLDDAL
ncbi:hypothetical protein CYMTET_22821 [Cymbomonas tetramitiformis]|uniref:Polycystin cation channel PKD1/PKD2 domain-containing protein n=1 Tax=Cymbomonas tetramitiformis TaxID=36881 RepID=A0AAE0FZG7_9CHLO|nr:hypothetical protein CYMTET_22821 [Cymbomonas tetramitiformis]